MIRAARLRRTGLIWLERGPGNKSTHDQERDYSNANNPSLTEYVPARTDNIGIPRLAIENYAVDMQRIGNVLDLTVSQILERQIHLALDMIEHRA